MGENRRGKSKSFPENPCFEKLGEDRELAGERIYRIPEQATHVGVWNGHLNFFRSNMTGDYRGQKSKWRFFFLGEKKENHRCGVSFPEYHVILGDFGPSGRKHNYGQLSIILLEGNPEGEFQESEAGEKD